MAYAYSFQGTGSQDGNPFFELISTYPQIGDSYAILSGVAVFGPTVLLAAIAGKITDQVNRVQFLGLASILWSLTTISSGTFDNFALFCTMRVLFGVLTTAANPPALSLIRDYFSPGSQSLANSIYLNSYYLGIALSSLNLLIIENFGWRASYDIAGLIGLFCGVGCLTLLPEPEKAKS